MSMDLKEGELRSLLQSFPEHAYTAKAQNYSATLIEAIKKVQPNRRVQLLLASYEDGSTILHRLAKIQDFRTIINIFGLIETADKNGLMLTKNNMGETALHSAVLSGSVATVEALLNISAEQNILEKIIQACTTDNDSVLHYATVGGHDSLINILLNGISKEARFDFIKRQRSDGRTVLHCAAQYDNFFVIQRTLGDFSADQTLELLNIQDCNGRTAQEVAELTENQQAAMLLQRSRFPKPIDITVESGEGMSGAIHYKIGNLQHLNK